MTVHRTAICSSTAAVTRWHSLPLPPVWPAREWGPAPMPGRAGPTRRTALPGGWRTPESCQIPYGPALLRPCPLREGVWTSPGLAWAPICPYGKEPLLWWGSRTSQRTLERRRGRHQRRMRRSICGEWLFSGRASRGGRAVALDLKTRGAVHRTVLGWPEGNCCGRAARKADGLVLGSRGERPRAHRKGLDRHMETDSLHTGIQR